MIDHHEILPYIILYILILLIPVILCATHQLSFKFMVIIDAILLLPFSIIIAIIWAINRNAPVIIYLNDDKKADKKHPNCHSPKPAF